MFAIAPDVKYAVRMLRAAPGFTAVAVVALALGIGATTAMFSVVDGVLVRPLPYWDPDRLVQLWSQNLERGIPFASSPYPDVAVWQREGRSFDALSAYTVSTASLAAGVEPEPVSVARVNAAFFSVLGVSLTEGRPFLPEEDRPGAAAVAVSAGCRPVTSARWRSRCSRGACSSRRRSGTCAPSS